MNRPVTIITISTHVGQRPDSWVGEPFTEEAMATIHSVQVQTCGVDKWDLSIVRKVDETTVQRLYEFAAQHATTEWIALIPEGEVLKPDALENVLEIAEHSKANAVAVDRVMLWRRSYYLEGAGA